jgi:hypothetical protein
VTACNSKHILFIVLCMPPSLVMGNLPIISPTVTIVMYTVMQDFRFSR